LSDNIPSLTAPVVLAHGLCGFDRIFVFRRPVKEYFPGIRQGLESAGNRVLATRVSATAGIADRASQLKAFIRQEVGQSPVHVIGHSMGGLDARYMISRLGMDRQVLSLTTVGTPHRGTAFADWGIRRLSRLLCPVFRSAGVPVDAFFDLTTDACRRFNERVPDAPGVRYFSVAGVCEKPWLGPEYILSSRIIAQSEGCNDGLVSVASASWGEQTDIWTGDHLNLVNWPNRRMRRAGEWHDRITDYGQLLGRLPNVRS
jgi:triacylglycerol lipase